MKKVEFSSIAQLILFVITVSFAGLTFIGMFFNPLHIVTFAMSTVLSIAIYKEKNW